MNPFEKNADSLNRTQIRLADKCPVFTWGGQVWKMIPGTVTQGKDLSPGGYVLDFALSFEVLVAQFGETLPETKQAVTYLGEGYRIETIGKRPGNLQWIINCQSDVQGA